MKNLEESANLQPLVWIQLPGDISSTICQGLVWSLVLAALAALFPWELGEKADAFAAAPAGIKREWYFLSP